MSKINYNLSLIKAVVFDIDGVLSPSCCGVDTGGYPIRMINCKDGYALQLAVKKGLKICVITGAGLTGIEQWLKRLGIEDIYSHVATKKSVLVKWMAQKGLEPDEIAFVGDDIPDLPCMEVAGLPVCPSDAAEDIRHKAGYIAVASGGHGVAREIIEEVLRTRDLWLDESSDYDW